MQEILQRLRQRKLAQWAVAYVAFGFALLQGVDIVAQQFGWPAGIRRGITLALAIGFFATLVLAWYHGERGVQRATGTELLILALLLAIGGGLMWHFARAPSTLPAAHPSMAIPTPPVSVAPATAVPAKSIAVLPFENMSDDKGNAYFADGMQDLILTKLADIGELKVVSRTSTAQYASHPEDLKSIAQRLGVANILEGSVQKAGKDVLINVQLIDARTDNHLWAQSYQRTLDNIFGVEGEVADKVADALKAKLTQSESAAVDKVGTRNPVALDAYLRGKYFINQANRTGERSDLEQAVQLFQQAIAADPDYVYAWADLALAYQKLGGRLQDAEAAARRALALDPGSAKAHTEVAFVLAGKGNFDAAIAESEKAIALPSHSMNDLAGLGFNLFFAGKIEVATQAFQRAEQADPLSDFPREWVALTQAYVRNYAAARARLSRVVAHDPGNASAVGELAQVERVGMGDLDAARKALKSAAASAASSATLSDAWYELEYAARAYPAALAVIAAAPSSLFDKKPRALYEATIFRAQGDTAKAQATSAIARDQLMATLKSSPADPQLHAALALALAGTGDDVGALAEAKRAVALVLVRDRVWMDPYMKVNLALVEMQAGQATAAIQVLDRLLVAPAGLDMSVEELRLSPRWDPLRTNPQFQALLQKYAKDKSAAIPVLPATRAGNVHG